MRRGAGNSSESEPTAETPGIRQATAGAGGSRRNLMTSHPMIRATVVALTVLAVVSVANAYRSQPLAGFLLSMFVIALGGLSYIDIAEQRLPNKMTLSMAVISATAVLLAGLVQSKLMTSLGAVALGVGFGFVLLLLQFGFGDVKLALSIGTIAGWLGTPAIIATVLVASTSGALAAGVLMILYRRRSLSFGFGPFLALGSLAGMLAAAN